MSKAIMNGLGQALRWLRDRQGKKQYQVANAAGITKGMLSAYETGRQRPSLDTLEKILGTLECDLNDLHNAIQIINGRPEHMKRKGDGLGEEEGESRGDFGRPQPMPGARVDLQRALGVRGPLPPEEERALSSMLEGFHRFLRYLHQTLEQALKRRQPEEPETEEDL